MDFLSPSVLSYAAPSKLCCSEVAIWVPSRAGWVTLGGSWALTAFCTQQLPRQGFKTPNKSMLRPGSPGTQTGGTQACSKNLSRSKGHKDMLCHKCFLQLSSVFPKDAVLWVFTSKLCSGSRQAKSNNAGSVQAGVSPGSPLTLLFQHRSA